jgi:hypothetical protein
MWPWEHLAFGYVLYSLYAHARGRGSPLTVPVLFVLFATQFPDLVDKPLAWGLGVLPSGRSLAHSLLFATPAIALVGVTGVVARAPRVGPGFAIGYLSHLAGDVIYPLLVKGELHAGFLLWPIVPASDSGSLETFHHVRELLLDFLAFAATSRGAAYLAFDGGLLLGALLLWVHDGMPGVRPVLDALTPPATPERE